MTQASRPPLAQLLRPRSIALLGVSDRNPYSALLRENVEGIEFTGRLHVVNKRGVPALGLPAVTTCAAIGEPVDAGIVLVPGEAVLEVVSDAVAAGIRNLVVISSGFVEVGGEGATRQQQLLDYCGEHGVNVLGPNCLGYQNHVDRVALGGIPFIRQQPPGALAVVSASGSIAFYMAQAATQQGLGVSHVLALGNEMNVTTADVLDALIDDPRVKGFALFIEAVRDPQRFAQAAERARMARKPIVAIKVGASEATAAVAAAHTGALVGDDRVFNAACEEYGIVRVAGMEECIATAGTLLSIGPVSRPGVAMMSISGGNCGIVSDLCALHQVPLPPFAEETRSALRGVVSQLGRTLNPIDLTGHATRDFSLWSRVPQAISADPAIGLTIINMELPSSPTPYMPESLPHIEEAVRSCLTPVLLMANIAIAVNDYGRAFLARCGTRYAAPGLDLGISAVGKLLWWSERVQRASERPGGCADTQAPRPNDRPSSEREVLEFLAGFGVPVIPAEVVSCAAEAAAAARRHEGPAVLKIVSPDIAHKTDIGAVQLNVTGDSSAREAYGQIMAAVAAEQPRARIDGVSVSPLRSGGVEILVGVVRDPQWGLVMALGLGGVWVEALRDTVLRLLPVTEDEVVRALGTLRGAKLLEGLRGAPAVDLRALARVAVRIGEAALALGPDLDTLEVNPLFARGDHIEALDALAVWRQ